MLVRQPAKLMRLHFSEHDRYQNVPLYKAIDEACQRLGIAGMTAFRGLEGYGESVTLHQHHLLAHDQPIVVTIVDSASNIERLVAEVAKMLDTGMIAISDVAMIRIEAP